jgi:hypothetical protein
MTQLLLAWHGHPINWSTLAVASQGAAEMVGRGNEGKKRMCWRCCLTGTDE